MARNPLIPPFAEYRVQCIATWRDAAQQADRVHRVRLLRLADQLEQLEQATSAYATRCVSVRTGADIRRTRRKPSSEVD
jgi:hypothetical protein